MLWNTTTGAACKLPAPNKSVLTMASYASNVTTCGTHKPSGPNSASKIDAHINMTYVLNLSYVIADICHLSGYDRWRTWVILTWVLMQVSECQQLICKLWLIKKMFLEAKKKEMKISRNFPHELFLNEIWKVCSKAGTSRWTSDLVFMFWKWILSTEITENYDRQQDYPI